MRDDNDNKVGFRVHFAVHDPEFTFASALLSIIQTNLNTNKSAANKSRNNAKPSVTEESPGYAWMGLHSINDWGKWMNTLFIEQSADLTYVKIHNRGVSLCSPSNPANPDMILSLQKSVSSSPPTEVTQIKICESQSDYYSYRQPELDTIDGPNPVNNIPITGVPEINLSNLVIGSPLTNRFGPPDQPQLRDMCQSSSQRNRPGPQNCLLQSWRLTFPKPEDVYCMPVGEELAPHIIMSRMRPDLSREQKKCLASCSRVTPVLKIQENTLSAVSDSEVEKIREMLHDISMDSKPDANFQSSTAYGLLENLAVYDPICRMKLEAVQELNNLKLQVRWVLNLNQ